MWTHYQGTGQGGRRGRPVVAGTSERPEGPKQRPRTGVTRLRVELGVGGCCGASAGLRASEAGWTHGVAVAKAKMEGGGRVLFLMSWILSRWVSMMRWRQTGVEVRLTRSAMTLCSADNEAVVRYLEGEMDLARFSYHPSVTMKKGNTG
ncbi:hypothetical protein Nepgr_020891 [Nepenthes gracilis]|uniref:Uncharacterized protein n=1 Tax=Nepenthes gracilis TaxID=150966 RepID=A0AAD3XWP3_NEPGR|nr:hypothetical protein Nepgr_020891 [Nepenthes gracilis]